MLTFGFTNEFPPIFIKFRRTENHRKTHHDSSDFDDFCIALILTAFRIDLDQPCSLNARTNRVCVEILKTLTNRAKMLNFRCPLSLQEQGSDFVELTNEMLN